MTNGIEKIGNKDILWSLSATIFMVGAGVILLPFILNKMPAETVGIWNIFQTITFLILMLDFGFRPSFSRNISYIFSGVQSFQQDGVEGVEPKVNYALLSGTLVAMRRFYRRIAILTFLLLGLFGTAYMWFVLQKYNGDRTDAYAAWGVLVFVNCINLYTFYYDALLTGKGYIRRMQQINIVGQLVYILVAIVLIYAKFGLIAIVAAQLLNIVIKRVLMRGTFFTPSLRQQLSEVEPAPVEPIMAAIRPNAIKMGLTTAGGILVNKSAILIGGALLPLPLVAAYGITLQVMDILSRCATVVYQVYTPRLAECRAAKDYSSLKYYFKLNCISILAIFVIGGLSWICLGDWALALVGSKTQFVPDLMLLAMLLFAFLEQNHSTAAGFLLADNKVPFFVPSLLSGLGTVVLLLVFMYGAGMGLWGLILAPGIAQLCYQNWKWPLTLIRDLND